MNKNLFRAALASAGVTQCELAKQIGLSESSVIRKVKNDSFTLREAKLISKYLNVDGPALFFDK